jgi:hypothetical protein
MITNVGQQTYLSNTFSLTNTFLQCTMEAFSRKEVQGKIISAFWAFRQP